MGICSKLTSAVVFSHHCGLAESHTANGKCPRTCKDDLRSCELPHKTGMAKHSDEMQKYGGLAGNTLRDTVLYPESSLGSRCHSSCKGGEEDSPGPTLKYDCLPFGSMVLCHLCCAVRRCLNRSHGDIKEDLLPRAAPGRFLAQALSSMGPCSPTQHGRCRPQSSGLGTALRNVSEGKSLSRDQTLVPSCLVKHGHAGWQH